MRTLCDTLLDDTRGGTLTAPGSSEVLPTLRHPTESLDMPGNVTLTADGPPLVAGVPPALLERVVSPLLADACRYARSSVAVRACSAPDGVRVEITDDGPPVYQPRSPDSSSNPVDAATPTTGTAEPAWS
ncbi:signal transduction histidine kinase [Streptomyces sp. B3I8]|nr:signal transduction histidine kinase [Streptomyces sp. B3I8]